MASLAPILSCNVQQKGQLNSKRNGGWGGININIGIVEMRVDVRVCHKCALTWSPADPRAGNGLFLKEESALFVVICSKLKTCQTLR